MDEVPKFLDINPTNLSYDITVDHEDDQLSIPLSLNRVTSYFPSHVATQEEYDKIKNMLPITDMEPEWNPHSNIYSNQEELCIDRNEQVFISVLNSVVSHTQAVNVVDCTSQMLCNFKQHLTNPCSFSGLVRPYSKCSNNHSCHLNQAAIWPPC